MKMIYKKTTISVVMSVYNEPLEWLKESIESIINQTYKNFEFIIINDNSLDQKLSNFLNYYKNKYSNIVLIENPENLGLTKSLNIGLKAARGTYVARMDADDISLPNRLETQLDFMSHNAEIFLIGSGTYNIDQDGKIIKNCNPIIEENKLKKKLLKKNCICHSTIFFKNKENCFYREKFLYAQDYDFYLRLIYEKRRILNIPEKLIKYRINPHAITYSNRAKQKLFGVKALEFYFQNLHYGNDDYNAFDQSSILSIDIETTENPIVLQVQIANHFLFGNYQLVKSYCKKYFKYHGIFNKFLIYYILSFSNTKIINGIRRLNLFDQVSTKQIQK